MRLLATDKNEMEKVLGEEGLQSRDELQQVLNKEQYVLRKVTTERREL